MTHNEGSGGSARQNYGVNGSEQRDPKTRMTQLENEDGDEHLFCRVAMRVIEVMR